MTNLYPYIPEGKEIKYVSATDTFMREAERVRNTTSTDLNHPTGAVIVLNNDIIGRGSNQSALKNKTLIQFHKNGWCIRRLLNIPSGKKYWLCPGCSSFRHHAEPQAIQDARSLHDSIDGASIYLYGHWWCCKSCWDTMMSAGIKKVYLVEDATNLFR